MTREQKRNAKRQLDEIFNNLLDLRDLFLDEVTGAPLAKTAREMMEGADTLYMQLGNYITENK